MDISKTRALAVLLVLGAATLAGKTPGQFRLKKDPNAPMRGWILEHDDEGFRFEQFGSRARRDIKWDDLVEEDARRLRIEFGLDLTEKERLGLIEGHEVFFKGGGAVQGVLEEIDETGRHWVRSGGVVLQYPGDRIDRVEEIQVREADVYDEQEVYLRRLERRPPRNASEHADLAQHMFEVGNWTKSQEHFGKAIELDADRREAIEPKLAELRDILQDVEAATFFRKALSRANLRGDYDGALEMIEGYVAEFPGAKRRGLLVADRIRVRRTEKMRARYHRLKSEVLDRSIRRYLVRQAPDLEVAMSWVTASLAKELEKEVQSRLGVDKEELESLRKSKARGAPHWATYWGGTFVVSKRASRGKATKRTVRGDPEEWWGNYPDVNTRATFLKAYAVERLPELFEIVSVRNTPCERCGGKGTVRKSSLQGIEGVGHEWKEKCPRCFGAQEDRSVGYR